MKKFILLTLTAWALHFSTNAQVAINTTGAAPAAAAMLDISSSTKGVRIPRMTSEQRKQIAAPDMGLLVYDIDKQTIFLFDGFQWKAMMVADERDAPLVSRTATGASAYSGFGESAAIFGDYAVVGAPGDSANGVNSGAVYVFMKENGVWLQQQKLSPPNGVDADSFGASVDIHGDVIVVGAPNKAISGIPGRGRVYVFRRFSRSWNYDASLQASNGLAGDEFGKSVQLGGIYLVAGAPYANFNGQEDAGAAYIFGVSGNTWTQKTILHPAVYSAHANFGRCVAINGSFAVVGAPKALTNNTITGAAYAFRNSDGTGSNWVESQKFDPGSSEPSGDFGAAIAINQGTLLISAPQYKQNLNTSAGKVWRYVNNNTTTWTYTGTIIGVETNQHTGHAVATDGTHDFYSAIGWQSYMGRAVLKSDLNFKYFHDEDSDTQRIYGWALDMHNGQIMITAKNLAPYGGTGWVFFGQTE